MLEERMSLLGWGSGQRKGVSDYYFSHKWPVTPLLGEDVTGFLLRRERRSSQESV